MVTKVNDTDLKVLSLFTKGYGKEYYIREVERLLQISSRTALLTLAKLEKRGILESKVKGTIKTYAIRKSGISKEYFILTEQYKLIAFLEKNHLVKEVLEKIDTFSEGIVLIFGSYAKAIQKEDSDLDLFIAGTSKPKDIREIGRRYGIEISIKSYPLDIFTKEINTDVLLKEIVENHIIIKGAEQFVERVLPWTR